MFHNILFSCLLLFTSLAYAQGERKSSSKHYGMYVDLGGGAGSDGGSGSEKLKGSTYSGAIGYRWNTWAFEIGYTSLNFKANPGVANDFIVNIDKATIKGGGIDAILRATFWRFFTFGLGYTRMSLEHDFEFSNINNDPNASLNSKDKNTYSGGVAQLGLVLPLWRFLDLRLMYEVRSLVVSDLTSEEEDASEELPIDPYGGTIQNFTGHIVFYFR